MQAKADQKPRRIPAERPNSNCIAGRLRDLRMDQKLTQVEIAEVMGIGRDTYRAYEDGSRLIKGENLRQLVEVLNIDAEWLLTGRVTADRTP